MASLSNFGNFGKFKSWAFTFEDISELLISEISKFLKFLKLLKFLKFLKIYQRFAPKGYTWRTHKSRHAFVVSFNLCENKSSSEEKWEMEETRALSFYILNRKLYSEKKKMDWKTWTETIERQNEVQRTRYILSNFGKFKQFWQVTAILASLRVGHF